MTEPTESSVQSTFEAKAFILDLPDELQIRILRWLGLPDLLKVTRVCRKWKQLALDGSLWTKIDAAPFYKSIPGDQLVRMGVTAGKFLRVANLRGCIQLTDHGLRTLSNHCKNVQVLCLKDCRSLSSGSITHFLRQATDVRVLDLSGVDSVRDGTLISVALLAQLEKLNLAWCNNITGLGVQIFSAHCHKLSYLNLNGCVHMDEATMNELCKLPRLSHLSLASCTSLTDAALISFLTHSTSPLTHLNLSNCTLISDATLRHPALHSKAITHLELAGCTLVTDNGFSYLAPRLRTLVHLDLEDLKHITDVTVKALAGNEPQLYRLCLSNCTNITDEAITHLVLHGVCHQLSHLELDNCSVTDAMLDTIARFLTSSTPPSTMSVDSLSFSSAVTDRKLNVEVLDCSNITEKGVRTALARASPRLTIKSFYSWRFESDNTYLHTVSPLARRNHTIGRQRRRRNTGGGHPQAVNCAIL